MNHLSSKVRLHLIMTCRTDDLLSVNVSKYSFTCFLFLFPMYVHVFLQIVGLLKVIFVLSLCPLEVFSIWG